MNRMGAQKAVSRRKARLNAKAGAFRLVILQMAVQLLFARPIYAFMKTGDLIAISIINKAGRKIDTVSILRIDGATVFADVSPEAAGGALKMTMKLDIVPEFIYPNVGDAPFRYRGEIRGAVFIPDEFWV